LKLKGKVAIVTGSRQGLGKAFALGFAKEGADVVVCDRVIDDGKLEEVAKEITSLGRRSLALPVDVTSEADLENLVKKTVEEFGRIDILVNNAGIAFHYSVPETTLKQWNLVLSVTLTGAFLCSKAVLPKMMEQKSGSIINISSLAANDRTVGEVPTGIAYGVAKAGIERLTWGMAAEMGQYNIAVNAIKPVKVVNTEGMRFWMADADKSQWQTPEKMVKCAIFLAAQDGQGVTGTVATDDELVAWHDLK
jgi:NAD(P)-dependent dehydrogenase (short-subunit alcohol dehydrogenase family)